MAPRNLTELLQDLGCLAVQVPVQKPNEWTTSTAAFDSSIDDFIKAAAHEGKFHTQVDARDRAREWVDVRGSAWYAQHFGMGT